MKNIIDKSNRKYLVYSICFLPLVMLAIQSIFNGLCFAFGSDYWNIAFMDRGDLFGDFIKYNPAFQYALLIMREEEVKLLNKQLANGKSYIINLIKVVNE